MKSKHKSSVAKVIGLSVIGALFVLFVLSFIIGIKVINNNYNESGAIELSVPFLNGEEIKIRLNRSLWPNNASPSTIAPSLTPQPPPVLTLEPTSVPTPTATTLPYVTGHTTFTATASSVYQLKYNGEDYSVGPDMAVDGNLKTAWNEGGSELGIGEWIRLRPSDDIPRLYNGFSIANGFQYRDYHKDNYNDNRWTKNARVSSLDVYGDDTYIGTFAISDKSDGYEDIYFPEPVYCLSLKFVIKSAVNGTKFPDTCISEIRPF